MWRVVGPMCTPPALQSATITLHYTTHLCITMEWPPSHTALQSATTLHYTTHLCIILRWHPFPMRQSATTMHYTTHLCITMEWHYYYDYYY